MRACFRVVGYSFVGLYSIDPDYADILLAHARKLYDFGYDVRKKYTESIPDAAQFYQYVSSVLSYSIFGCIETNTERKRLCSLCYKNRQLVLTHLSNSFFNTYLSNMITI